MLALVSSVFNLQLVWIWSNITKIFIQGRIVKISLKIASEYRCLIIVPGNINMCMLARTCVCIYIYTFPFRNRFLWAWKYFILWLLKTWQLFSQICRLFLTISSHPEYLKYIYIIIYMLIIVIKLYNNNNNAVL